MHPWSGYPILTTATCPFNTPLPFHGVTMAGHLGFLQMVVFMHNKAKVEGGMKKKSILVVLMIPTHEKSPSANGQPIACKCARRMVLPSFLLGNSFNKLLWICGLRLNVQG